MLKSILTFALVMPALFASEHHGIVRYNGLPVPGATATATRGEDKLVAVSNLEGFYLFPELAPGLWTVRVEMLGFQPLTREIKTGADSSTAEWDLTMLPMSEMRTEPAPALFQQTEMTAPNNAGAEPAAEASPSGTFANLSGEQLAERAADGFLINGSINNGAVSPFAQPAAFGNNRRGYRSLYNGSLGIALNNSALDARSFSLTGQNTAKPDYNRLQLSITIGGPLTGRKYSSSLVDPDKLGIQPRIGFAWRPMAASSLVVRGGYGIYRDTAVYRSIALQMAQQSPFSKSLSVGNSPATPLTLANGFNIPARDIANTFAVDPDFRAAIAQNWQLSIQRDLPWAMQMIAMYMGSRGSHLIQRSLPNTYPAGTASGCAACPSGFLYQSSGGESIRHAGQVQIRRRLRNGFAANARYLFSKSIDDAALVSSASAQNWLDLEAERALSNFDQRDLLEIQAQYTTGSFGFHSILLNGWKGTLCREWTLAGQITIGSGMPLTPIYSAATPGTGITGSIRPNSTGASISAAPPGSHLNPAAFAPPAAGAWGNAGRNSITGPAQFSLDASLGRSFRLGDRWNVEFRLDAKNILNHVTFPSWNTIINSSQFGLPDRANQMRTVQANLRISL